MSRLHADGRFVFAYTADRPHTMRRLIDTRIDGIFTNVPDRLANILETCQVIHA